MATYVDRMPSEIHEQWRGTVQHDIVLQQFLKMRLQRQNAVTNDTMRMPCNVTVGLI